jgi:hypothetical protein
MSWNPWRRGRRLPRKLKKRIQWVREWRTDLMAQLYLSSLESGAWRDMIPLMQTETNYPFWRVQLRTREAVELARRQARLRRASRSR